MKQFRPSQQILYWSDFVNCASCDWDRGDESLLSLAQSRTLKQLGSLILSESTFNDQGMCSLLSSPLCESVESLHVSGPQLTGATMAALGNSPHLRRLSDLSIDVGVYRTTASYLGNHEPCGSRMTDDQSIQILLESDLARRTRVSMNKRNKKCPRLSAVPPLRVRTARSSMPCEKFTLAIIGKRFVTQNSNRCFGRHTVRS